MNKKMVKKSFWIEEEQAKWIEDASKAREKKIMRQFTESNLMREVIDGYRGQLIAKAVKQPQEN